MTPGPQPAPAVLWHRGLPAGPLAPWAPEARIVPRRTASSWLIFSTPPKSVGPSSVCPQCLGFWRGRLTPSIRVCSAAVATPGHRCGGMRPGPNRWLPWPPAGYLPFAGRCSAGLGLGCPSGLPCCGAASQTHRCRPFAPPPRRTSCCRWPRGRLLGRALVRGDSAAGGRGGRSP